MPQPHRLRRLGNEDASAVLEAFGSDPLMERQGTVRGIAQAQQYIASLSSPGSGQLPIAVTCNDQLVGLVCASIDTENSIGWFWYWMHAAHRGNGIGTRAAATFSSHLLTEGGLHRLELGVRRNNPASIKVARGAGFIHEGIEREKFLVDGERVDVFTYGRLRTDPRPDIAELPLEL